MNNETKPRHKDNPLFAEWAKMRKNQDIWDAGKEEAIKMGIVEVLSIGQKFTCHCELMCHCKCCWITGLKEDEVTYKYYSTNVDMERYECEKTTTEKHFRKMWKRDGIVTVDKEIEG